MGDGTSSNNNDGTIHSEYKSFRHTYTEDQSHTIIIKSDAFQKVDCANNALTDLDVSQCKLLEFLECNNNYKLTKLDISYCLNLKGLNCSRNQITKLNVRNCPKLSALVCNDNPLTNLDLNNSSTLVSLNCSKTQITDLNVGNCKSLSYLYCSETQITELDVSNCHLLKTLKCIGTPLNNLDVSNCILLSDLNCSFTQLTNLNVKDCINLEILACSQTKIASLDVSECSKLYRLELYECRSLKYLNYNRNKLEFNETPFNDGIDYRYCYNLSVPNPKGTIAINMRNVDKGNTVITPEGFNSGFYIDSENFCGDNYQFVRIDKMKGLGNLNDINYPQAGWSESVAVTPGYGYLARHRYKNDEGLWVWDGWINIYVVRELIGADDHEPVIGAEIQYVIKRK